MSSRNTLVRLSSPAGASRVEIDRVPILVVHEDVGIHERLVAVHGGQDAYRRLVQEFADPVFIRGAIVSSKLRSLVQVPSSTLLARPPGTPPANP